MHSYLYFFDTIPCVGRCEKVIGDLDVQGGPQQIPRCFCETDIQVNFIYKPAESQHATEPKSHLLAD